MSFRRLGRSLAIALLACICGPMRLEASLPTRPPWLRTASPPSPPAARPRVTPPARHRAVRPRATRRTRPLPALLAQPRNMPILRPIPKAVALLLQEGAIASATRRLYLEPASVKNLFLIREMERIGEAETGVKPMYGGEHRHYLNLAIAYHNLYLFLRADGIEHKKFARKAGAAYRRALRGTEGTDRDEVETLWAALEMASGHRKAAERRFRKGVDPLPLQTTYRGATYLATYYAATGDLEGTIAVLRQAKSLDTTENLTMWLQLADDFAPLRAEPAFEALLQEWRQ